MRNQKCQTVKGGADAFTLAEVIITLSILGIIAAIILPASISNYTEGRNKAAMKIAFSTYQKAIDGLISTDLQNQRSVAALRAWGNNDGNCTNSRGLFKIQEESNSPNALRIFGNDPGRCIFKTVDGTWWNVTYLDTVIIGLESYMKDGSAVITDFSTARDNSGRNNKYRSFVFVTDFQDSTGAVRISDAAYETSIANPVRYADAEKIRKYLYEKNVSSLRSRYDGYDGIQDTDRIEVDSDWGTHSIDSCTRNTETGVVECANTGYSEQPAKEIPKTCKNMGYIAWVGGVGGSYSFCTSWEQRFTSPSGDDVVMNFSQNPYDENNNLKPVIPSEGTEPFTGWIWGGGYFCQNDNNGGFQCHINGSQVPDIAYDKNGNVTGYTCTPKGTYSGSVGDCGELKNSKICTNALCDYDTEKKEWRSTLKEQDQYQAQKLRCMFVAVNGGKNSDCDIFNEHRTETKIETKYDLSQPDGFKVKE